MRSKPEFGKFSAEDAAQIDTCVHTMVYADSEDTYGHAYDELMRGYASALGGPGQDRWVMYKRADLPHFSNHTNNTLECFFGKLKNSVDGSKSMVQCVKGLVAYDRRFEN
ncbi:hypothetical protein PHMEG_00020004 [Phytophthora megakarya]|uniref:Uncharacterized protein n=1 Tax=Phytophthora megakarya TaxID=4795 RepID=A0A225VS24_9STRA|nr:hypothetical protein PHMEG_00020004 [Phytophthora megakarya]